MNNNAVSIWEFCLDRNTPLDTGVRGIGRWGKFEAPVIIDLANF